MSDRIQTILSTLSQIISKRVVMAKHEESRDDTAETLTLTFEDGTTLKVTSVDPNEYQSWLDIEAGAPEV